MYIASHSYARYFIHYYLLNINALATNKRSDEENTTECAWVKNSLAPKNDPRKMHEIISEFELGCLPNLLR